MPAYIKINSEEHKAINKAVLEALASSLACQSTALRLARLKRSKKPAIAGMATALKEAGKELENIKKALPESELLVKQVKQTKLKARTKYEQELEAIKERISKL